MPGASRPNPARMASGLPSGMKVHGTPSTDTGGAVWPSSSAGAGDGSRHGGAGAAVGEAVLDRDDGPVAGGVGDHVGVERLDAAHVPHGGLDAVGGQRAGGSLGRFEHLAHGQQAHVGTGADAATAQPGADLVVGDRTGRGLGEADGHRPGGDGESVGEHLAHLLVAARRQDRHPRHLREQHHVEHAVVAGAVVAGDAGAVEDEHHRLLVQGDVVHHLVDRPGEERGVDGDDRAQAAHGHAGRRGDGVLLGDADVDQPAGEALAEREQTGGVRHGRGEGHQVRVVLAGLADGLGEGGSCRRSRWATCRAAA